MFKNKGRLKKIVVTSLASIMVLGSVSFAAAKIYTEKIDVTYGRVKVNYNGKDVTTQVETKYGTKPFVANKTGRTYVPVRALADIMGVNVRWDQASNTAYLTSNAGNLEYLQQQLSNLQAENEILKAKLKDSDYNSNSKRSMRDIERDLKKDYGTYEKIDFDISLRGDSRRADLEINVDLGSRRDKDAWDDLRDRDVERFIEKMIDDIQREYRDCDVKGYIRDSDAREKLYTFRKDGTRRIEIDEESSSSSDKDLEKDLEKRYDSLKSVKKIKFDVKENRKDDYTITVKVDYDRYEDEWDRVKDSDLETYLDDIQSYASKYSSDYKKADIEIEVESDNGRIDLASYSANGRFRRYE